MSNDALREGFTNLATHQNNLNVFDSWLDDVRSTSSVVMEDVNRDTEQLKEMLVKVRISSRSSDEARDKVQSNLSRLVSQAGEHRRELAKAQKQYDECDNILKSWQTWCDNSLCEINGLINQCVTDTDQSNPLEYSEIDLVYPVKSNSPPFQVRV